MLNVRSIVSGLFVALALSAVTTAGAAAAPLEYKACVKVPKGSGSYTTGGCTTESSEGLFAAAFFGKGSEGTICLRTVPGMGKFEDSQCRRLGGTKDWALLPYLVSSHLNGKEPITLKGTVGEAKAKVTIKCKKLKANGLVIEGGETGAGSAEGLAFSECTAEEPAKCETGSSFTTVAVATELVESTTKPSKIEESIIPKVGTQFAELELKNKGLETCTVAGKIKLTGSILTEIGPQNEETASETLAFEPASKTYKTVGGLEKTSALLLAGNAATLTGPASVEAEVPEQTVSGVTIPAGKEDFGVF